jgi:hypothetical protein
MQPMEKQLRIGKVVIEGSKKLISVTASLFLLFFLSIAVNFLLFSKLVQTSKELEVLKTDILKTKTEITNLENSLKKYETPKSAHILPFRMGISKENLLSLKTELIKIAKRNNAEIRFVEQFSSGYQ